VAIESMMLDRRSFAKLALAANAALLLGGSARASGGLRFGPATPFSFDLLTDRARELARARYAPPPRPDPAIVAQLDYDGHRDLRFKPERALWSDSRKAFAVTFEHVGRYFPQTVRMNAVEGDVAREILYDPAYFEMPGGHPAERLPEQPSAFAGFSINEPSKSGDWVALEPWTVFLGASYFRASGEYAQVGLSARGIAIAPGEPAPEEFPDFVEFWFAPAESRDEPATVFALLDGPSVAGAYRFGLRRTKGVVMDIEARLFPRRRIERLGIAPLTSMYWFSETAKPAMIDWRPEVHDSDGLAMWTGTGEHIWRPLNNPPYTMVSSFLDDDPRGFGLLQRDRDFDNYQDGVRYEARPSAWVEPRGGWGRGAVQLVELHTDDEIHDNIVAMWVPAVAPEAGAELDYRYRLHWLGDEPYPTDLGRVVATRMGNGGQPGLPRPRGVRKFMVEFFGGPLANLAYGELPEPILTASRGTFSYIFAEAVPNDVPGHWRAQFDLTVDGTEPVDLRCYLRSGDKVLTETWLYQYHPDGSV
jgi:glucans biosynthesis protein